MAYAEISSFPPLGQLTVINEDRDTGEVDFVVLTEWHKVRPAYAFEFVLCYAPPNSGHVSQWPARTLGQLDQQPYAFRLANDEYQRITLGTSISIPDLFTHDETAVDALIYFTFKYRVTPTSPWKWVGGTAGATVGQLLRRRSSLPSPSISDILDIDDGQAVWHSRKLSGTEDFQVWEVSSADPIGDHSQGLCEMVLGRVKSQVRATSIIRLEPYWLGVSSTDQFFHLSEDGVLCNFLNTNGQVISLLAFNNNDKVYTVFRSSISGEVVVAARNDSHGKESFTILVAVGQSEHVSIKAVMDEARKRANQRSTLAPLAQLEKPKTSLQNDLLYDGLTFCTWNALGQKLTMNKVQAAVQQLSDHGIDISTLLIDDNWQTLGPTSVDPNMSDSFFCGMADFPANEAGFPSGLSGVIRSLRQNHPNIENVGVWHALFGYWSGISPGSLLAKQYKTREVQIRLMGEVLAEISIVDPSDIHRFYDEFYSYLKSQGVTFVKTDVQHMLSSLITSDDRREVIPAYQSAWTHAYLKHFSGRAISCMSQVPEIVLHSLLQDQTPKILFRNSDDFYPEVPASHPWHIFVNAHNSIMTEHLNAIPDWDMFQTNHAYSSYHAASRCISGGPIMLTDVPGKHDTDLIEQIACKSPTGRTIVLRPEKAKTLGIWEKYSDKNIVRIGSTISQINAALLGLFNISEDEKHTFVSATDFPNLAKSAIVIQSHRTEQVFPMSSNSSGTSLQDSRMAHVKLEAAGWDIITASTMLEFKKAQPQLGIAILGLRGKMSGIAGVVSQCIVDSIEKRSITVCLKALGTLRIWLSRTDLSVKNMSLAIFPSAQETSSDEIRVSIEMESIDIMERENGGILEVDLVKIFNKQKLWRPINSVEMVVELYLEL